MKLKPVKTRLTFVQLKELIDKAKHEPFDAMARFERNATAMKPTKEEIEEYKKSVTSVTDLESGITYSMDETGAMRAADGSLLPGTEWNPSGRWQDIPDNLNNTPDL